MPILVFVVSSASGFTFFYLIYLDLSVEDNFQYGTVGIMIISWWVKGFNNNAVCRKNRSWVSEKELFDCLFLFRLDFVLKSVVTFDVLKRVL